MIFSSNARKALVSLSICGLTVSVLVYVLSFSAVPVDPVFSWTGVLCVGMMALFLPIIYLEYPRSKNPFFFYMGFARGMPGWVAPCEWLLALFALSQVVWFALHSGLGVPSFQDGQYVIESRGQVLKVISRAEYLALKEAGLRMIAAMMASFYFVPVMYWWFHGQGASESGSAK